MSAGWQHWERHLRAAPLRQPDQLSCGASVAVVADAARADAPPPTPAAFATHVLHLHRGLTALRTADGWQLPWPRFWGTPPWALARHLTRLSGTPYRVRWCRWGRRTTRDVEAALAGGAPVPLYVGSRTLPRHVVLALATVPSPDGEPRWAVYDPASGWLRPLPVAQWQAGHLTEGWPVPWCVVLPTELSAPKRR